MDYHHPYNVYPEYYNNNTNSNNPPYSTNTGFPTNPAFMHHPTAGGGGMRHGMRNYNSILPNHSSMTPQGGQHPHQQHPHPHHHLPHNPHSYVPSFQQPKRSFHQNGNNQNYSSSSSSMFVPNFLVSSGTGLTPTLTPTTLATIEQSFMEMQHSGARDPVTQSGFVPPVVEPSNSNSADHSQDSYDGSSDDSDDWEPSAKKLRMKDGVKGVDYIVTSTGTINVAPQRKYTRRNKDEKLPPEEEERRRVRRERNKVAAAKCRQRRVDHTNELVEETEELIAVQTKLESEIQSLKQERDQLEFILQAHQPLCKVIKGSGSSGKVKSEPTIANNDSHHSHNGGGTCSPRPTHNGHHHSHSNHNNHSSHNPENLSKSLNTVISSSDKTMMTESSSSKLAAVTAIISSSSSSPSISSSIASARPNSLPLIKRDRARMLSMTSATGVTINTPTSGISITPSLFCPDLDAMVDGSTGLTPITGMSCSSQVQNRGGNENNTNGENVGSPNLISL